MQSNISGSFQIIYVRRDSTVVNPPNNVRSGEGLIEPYPLIYPCKTAGREFTGFAADTAWWAYDAFKLAFDITGNTQYNNAAEVTKWNTIKYLVENQKESYFYKKEPATEPLRYPGSYLVQTNSSNNVTIPSSGYTANRETTGALTNYLKLNVNAVSANQFPTMELQNYVTQVLFDYLVNVYIESSINTTALIEVKLSLSTNSNDFSQEWKAYWLLNGNGTSQNITFDYLAFFKPKPTTIWFTGIAQTPVYVYNTASWIYVQDNINGINSCITQITITDSTGGSGLINFTPTNKIPNIVYSLFGNCRVRFKDSTNTFWYVNLVATGKYSTFSGSWQSLFNVADRDITEIVFENTSDTTCVLKLFIVGELPDTLPVPCTIYKASVVCKLQTNYSWWIGDFKPNNNSLDKLPYTPGSIGFTLNTLNNVIQSFGRSQFYMAYQSPYSLSRWGFKEYAKNVVKLFNDSQESYINQSINRINGLLHQVFLPYDVENIPFLDRTQVVKSVLGTGVPFLFNRYVEYQTDTYEFNKFSWKGLDPNTQWSPYCFRAMEDLARYYYENTNDSLARKILTNFVKFIDKWNIDNNNSAITNIIPNNDPQALYFEPHLKAIEGLIMLYCNISGLETEITWKGIKNAFDYIDNQFVATGNMTGCWCKNQPTFTSGGQQYQEFFSFWQGKIIEFYSLCLINQNKIIQPNISTLPVFPLDFCNSPAHFIVNIKEPEFPIKYKNFRTGDSQKIILNDVPIGRLVSLRYEKLSESLTEQIITFYENCSLNFDGYFTFPSNYSYNDLNGKWIFIEEPKIKTFLGNSRKALFDIEIIVERN